ncbi:dTMP kinase [Tatumella punctata]|nr:MULTISPECIES: thymidylate kinase [unclassified Tatumella]
MINSSWPPLIAVIGSDGSGKSTICKYLINELRRYGPAMPVHLGKQAGNTGRALSALPLLGKPLKKAIVHNTKKIKSPQANVSLLSALVIMAFVGRRLLRFRRMLKYRRKGYIVLTDRFPQTQVPGGYDSPSFPEQITAGRVIQRMAEKERKLFAWMTLQQPDMVIKLNVSLNIACQRKPDHSEEKLARKIAVTPQLTFSNAEVVDIDADQPLNQVITLAGQAIGQFMERRGYCPPAGNAPRQ